MATRGVVSYLRVSTQKQGRSGLGLEAQQAAVTEYLAGKDFTLLEEFIEVESGKNRTRPKLTEAINLCKASGAILCVAKLDRLSRDAGFLMSLKDAGVDFVCADMPHADRVTIGILAVIAEQEREAISARTKAALAAAKKRGVQLGAYRDGKYVGAVGTPDTARRATEARIAYFNSKAVTLQPMLQRADPDGTLSLRAIATKLTDMGVPTITGKQVWSANTVKRLRDKLEAHNLKV